MANWNELFVDERNIKRIPEPAIYKVVVSLERLFGERPLNLWDLCCGAGRHTIAMARLGHKVYASDNAPNAIDLTNTWLTEASLQADVALADMTVCPWPEVKFHGVISWDALHHNTLANIRRAVDQVHRSLTSGGLFLGYMVGRPSTRNHPACATCPDASLPLSPDRSRLARSSACL